LVGKDCGATHYGASFVQIEREFDQLAARQLQLRRIDGLIQRFGPFLTFLATLRQHPSVQQVSRLHSEMEAAAEPLFRQLKTAARHRQGVLVVTERVRNLAAEAARKDKSTKPIYTEQTREVGRLAGWKVFAPEAELADQRIRYSHERAKDWFHAIGDNRKSDEWTAARLRELFAGLDEVIRTVETQ